MEGEESDSEESEDSDHVPSSESEYDSDECPSLEERDFDSDSDSDDDDPDDVEDGERIEEVLDQAESMDINAETGRTLEDEDASDEDDCNVKSQSAKMELGRPKITRNVPENYNPMTGKFYIQNDVELTGVSKKKRKYFDKVYWIHVNRNPIITVMSQIEYGARSTEFRKFHYRYSEDDGDYNPHDLDGDNHCGLSDTKHYIEEPPDLDRNGGYDNDLLTKGELNSHWRLQYMKSLKFHYRYSSVLEKSFGYFTKGIISNQSMTDVQSGIKKLQGSVKRARIYEGKNEFILDSFCTNIGAMRYSDLPLVTLVQYHSEDAVVATPAGNNLLQRGESQPLNDKAHRSEQETHADFMTKPLQGSKSLEFRNHILGM